jgi:hypothetical protein
MKLHRRFFISNRAVLSLPQTARFDINCIALRPNLFAPSTFSGKSSTKKHSSDRHRAAFTTIRNISYEGFTAFTLCDKTNSSI